MKNKPLGHWGVTGAGGIGKGQVVGQVDDGREVIYATA